MRSPGMLLIPGFIMCFTIAILVASITTPSLAVPQSVSLGPYNVSFDFNTTDSYSLSTGQSIRSIYSMGKTAYAYNLVISGTNGTIVLAITSYDSIYTVDFEDQKKIVEGVLTALDGENIKVSNEIIDGHVAALGGAAVESDEVVFCGSYSPDGVLYNDTYIGTTNCRFVSKFPVNETDNFLNSIHVEVPETT